jgi:hypothetical protein
MSDFQNKEEIVSHYKKVILPFETLIKVANAAYSRDDANTKIPITISVKGLFRYLDFYLH